MTDNNKILTAGCDEAGRGPWAGDCYASMVILYPSRPIIGLNDSKKLTPRKREALAEEIKQKALAWSITWSTVEEIDRIGILKATFLAMRRAAESLAITPELILVDGNQVPPDLPAPARAIVRGDNLEPAIMAASILAKTARDAAMCKLHETYPVYGFDKHMGYGTAYHHEQLRRHGPSPVHRKSFAPVKALLSSRPACRPGEG